MNNKYLLLHIADKNEPVCIKTESIAYIGPYHNNSIILEKTCKSINDGIIVNETATQIFNKTEEIFILVHEAETNLRILINKDIINMVSKEKEGTHICTDNFGNIYVNESVEKIYNSLALQRN